MIVPLDTTMSYAVYSDNYCQASNYTMNYIRTNNCFINDGQYQQLFCSTGSDSIEGTNPDIEGLNNTGFFTTASYYGLTSCNGYAQSYIYQLGVCIATSSTDAKMYYNYSAHPGANTFSVTYAEYNNMNCTLLASGFPKTTYYSTSCASVGGVYTQYSYSSVFKKQTNGIIQA
jgi:hypothetical protein